MMTRLPWWFWRPICKMFGHTWGIRADFVAGEYCRCSRPLRVEFEVGGEGE